VDDARRQKLLQLASGGVFLAIIAVVVVVIVAGSGGSDSGGEPTKKEQGEVGRLLSGIPQSGSRLGRPDAPVKIYEFGDLQCPFCKANAEEVTPQVIEKAVRAGEASITFRNFVIIGPQSVPAAEAALAAGAQDRAWNFIELFYRNQGEENSGYVTEEFIESIGKRSEIPDLARWNKERRSHKYKSQVEAETKEAEKLGFGGTPSFAIEGPATEGLEKIGTPESSGSLEDAIENAA
jgi:protein-disulfide isomerase